MIIVFTVIEVLALAVWLTQVLAGRAALGLAILLVGLVLEYIIADNVVHRKPILNLAGVPVGAIAVFSVVETGIWGVWLLLARSILVAALAFLIAGLIVEHSLTLNVARRLPVFSILFYRQIVGLTLVESVAATLWLQQVLAVHPVVGIAILAVGSVVEHSMLVALEQRLIS